MPLQCIVLSDSPSDRILGQKVAKILSSQAETEFRACSTDDALQERLEANPQSFVLWDIDVSEKVTERSIKKTGQTLLRFLAPERIFVISKEQISPKSPLANSIGFGHFLLRSEDPGLPEIVARLAMGCLVPRIDRIVDALNKGATVKKITLSKPSHRKAAIEALQQTLQKRSIAERVCKTIAKATDELLMNAFFKAPRDGSGVAYRANLSKTDDFEMSPKEQVTLEFVMHPTFFMVCVRDQFGSVQRTDVQVPINRDYQKLEYSPTQKVNGLGVYQTFKSGLSLMFLTNPGKETRAMLFFPIAQSFREFQKSFHFFSYISQG